MRGKYYLASSLTRHIGVFSLAMELEEELEGGGRIWERGSVV